jgi:hypothetical protein
MNSPYDRVNYLIRRYKLDSRSWWDLDEITKKLVIKEIIVFRNYNKKKIVLCKACNSQSNFHIRQVSKNINCPVIRNGIIPVDLFKYKEETLDSEIYSDSNIINEETQQICDSEQEQTYFELNDIGSIDESPKFNYEEQQIRKYNFQQLLDENKRLNSENLSLHDENRKLRMENMDIRQELDLYVKEIYYWVLKNLKTIIEDYLESNRNIIEQSQKSPEFKRENQNNLTNLLIKYNNLKQHLSIIPHPPQMSIEQANEIMSEVKQIILEESCLCFD